MKSTSTQGKAHVYLKALTTLGPGWAVQRAKLILLNRSGILERRTPLRDWGSLSRAGLLKPGIPTRSYEYCEWRRQSSPRFLFQAPLPAELLASLGGESIRSANCILRGEFPFFGYAIDLGFPPHWQRNPIDNNVAPGGHWSKIDEFALGDVKLWWEASRCSWAFTLGRAYARTQDDRYADAFWLLIESWMEQNPPNWGINWKCGQEASFRVMAICFALYVFAGSPASTPERVAGLVTLIGFLGQRIESYIEYAYSQKNNHGISEGAGLWTIGLLFPEFRASASWRNRGKRLIELEVRRQIYEDGSYVQHSTNYHRVMLHDLAWSLRLGENNNDQFAPDIYHRIRQSIRFLRGLADSESGWAPNYGANDGALVLPLTDCAFPDMRPVLQSCHFLLDKERLYDRGPWDEEMAWINGAASLAAAPPPSTDAIQSLSAEPGGYYTIRSKTSWIMLRGTRYKDRPSHADQLHLDLWWRGENVLCDAGTYSYNAPHPFEHALGSTSYHNTVTVGGSSQMTQVSRFLWADWADAEVHRSVLTAQGIDMLQGEHDGYASAGVTHRRAVFQPTLDAWIVVDDLSGNNLHTTRVHWLVPDVPFESISPGIVGLTFKAGRVLLVQALSAESRFDMVRAGERISGHCDSAPDPARGWMSRYYGRKDPALSLAVERRSLLPVRFVTVVLLGNICEVEIGSSCTTISVGKTQIELSAVGAFPAKVQFKSRC
jgi:hypothetical protein